MPEHYMFFLLKKQLILVYNSKKMLILKIILETWNLYEYK